MRSKVPYPRQDSSLTFTLLSQGTKNGNGQALRIVIVLLIGPILACQSARAGNLPTPAFDLNAHTLNSAGHGTSCGNAERLRKRQCSCRA